MYWLMADIDVRKETGNKKSVRDAARAALDAGGDGSQTWPIGKLLAVYDKGTGTKVFETLHDEMGLKADRTDLGALWKLLGVIYTDGEITFDDSAPLAGVRKGITAR